MNTKMTHQSHLEMIDEQASNLAEKYDINDCQEVILATLDFYKNKGFHKPWVGYLVLDSNVIVGAAGFNGKPEKNRVEISYYTFQEYENKGFASFACKELIKIAKHQNPSLVICAKTAPEENASTRILRNNGFVFTKVVQDHEIGDAWLWELATFLGS
jgi:RimJ/RimL family protein N-acetyltransferase